MIVNIFSDSVGLSFHFDGFLHCAKAFKFNYILNPTYKLLHSKENDKKKKDTYGMGVNSCKPCNQKWLNCQNIQTTHPSQ